jgi:hypothetical protein
MSVLSRTRRLFLKPLTVGLGALLGVAALLVGGWLLWSVLRPPPAGFPPTIGQAVGVVGQPLTVLQYTIDARSRRDWAYFDFSNGATVSASQDGLDWDLAFRRTDVLTNGGETNPTGHGGAIDLGKVHLGEAEPPADGYLADATHDERGLENPAMHNWYSYNWTTHIVGSKSHTYALRTATGEVALLTFLSYYCDDGSAGCITFQYVYPIGP